MKQKSDAQVLPIEDMARGWTEAELEYLRFLVSQNATALDIAECCGRDPLSVCTKCAELNLPLRKCRRVFGSDDIEILRDLVAAGKSGLEIAKFMNRGPLAIRAKCCALGLRLRRPPRTPTHRTILYLDPAIRARLAKAVDARGTDVTG